MKTTKFVGLFVLRFDCTPKDPVVGGLESATVAGTEAVASVTRSYFAPTHRSAPS